jgi:hypothetical protein
MTSSAALGAYLVATDCVVNGDGGGAITVSGLPPTTVETDGHRPDVEQPTEVAGKLLENGLFQDHIDIANHVLSHADFPQSQAVVDPVTGQVVGFVHHRQPLLSKISPGGHVDNGEVLWSTTGRAARVMREGTFLKAHDFSALKPKKPGQ